MRKTTTEQPTAVLMQDLLKRRTPGKVCFIYDGRRITYGELEKASDALAKKLKVNKGDRVLLRLADPVEQLLYFFAIIKAGGICVFADASFSGDDCRAMCIKYGLHWEIVAPLPDDAPDLRRELPENSPDDIFLGALSSGTTGQPKIIWRDQASWLAAFEEQGPLFGIDGNSIVYLAGEFVYTGNLNAAMHAFFLGATVVKAVKRMPRGWLAEIKEHKADTLCMVPANLQILLRVMTRPAPSIRAVVSGGAKMDKATMENLIKYFPQARIGEYYGSSELGYVSYASAADILARPDSVGRLFPGVSVSIKDGLIWVSSPYIVQTLRPEATSGDLGMLDDDGYLTIVGRATGVINVAGAKAYPETIEAVLKTHPDVLDAAVAGVSDPLKGQKVCAWLVRRSDTLTAAGITRFCRSNMPSHACPQVIVFLEELPLNNNGKVDRRALAARGE